MSQSGHTERGSTTRDASAVRPPNDKTQTSKPEYYYGDRNKFEDWVNQLLMYFLLEGVRPEKQALTAASYLRGEAQQWIRPQLQARLLRNEDPNGLFTSFQGLVQTMNGIYGLSNDKQVAIRNIQLLTQKTSASQYTAKFREYQAKTGWDDEALCTMYYRGLKDHVKDELVRAKVNAMAGLDTLVQEAISIDDRLYERSMEKRHTGQNRGRSGFVPNSWTGGQQRRDPNAMELDVTQRVPRKGNFKGRTGGRGKPQGKQGGPECYNCHKIGHYARDCRGPKVRPPQQQINAMICEENESPTDKTHDTNDILTEPYLSEPDPLHASHVRCPPFEWHEGLGRNQWVSDDYARLCEMDRIGWPMTDSEKTEYDRLEEGQRSTKELNVTEQATLEDQLSNILCEEGATLLLQETADRKVIEAGLLWAAYITRRANGDDTNSEEIKRLGERMEYLYDLSAILDERRDKLLEERDELEQRIQRNQRYREINIMEMFPRQQERDDGNHTRGRSPPPSKWTDLTLQQQNWTPSPTDDSDDSLEIPESISPLNLEEEPVRKSATTDAPRLIEQHYSVTTHDNMEATQESSDEESDDEPDDLEILHMSVDGPQPVITMILHIARVYEDVFPRMAGKRYLNARAFEDMLEQLRRKFWTYRQTDMDYTTYSYVREHVPMGGEFQHGGYLTPDGMFVNKMMRERVQLLGQRYKEILMLQDLYQNDALTFSDMKLKHAQHMRQWAIPPLLPPGPPTPVWRGMTLGHVKTTTYGQVQTRVAAGKVIFGPRDGPLSWEVCMETATSPDYYSKNE